MCAESFSRFENNLLRTLLYFPLSKKKKVCCSGQLHRFQMATILIEHLQRSWDAVLNNHMMRGSGSQKNTYAGEGRPEISVGVFTLECLTYLGLRWDNEHSANTAFRLNSLGSSSELELTSEFISSGQKQWNWHGLIGSGCLDPTQTPFVPFCTVTHFSRVLYILLSREISAEKRRKSKQTIKTSQKAVLWFM